MLPLGPGSAAVPMAAPLGSQPLPVGSTVVATTAIPGRATQASPAAGPSPALPLPFWGGCAGQGPYSHGPGGYQAVTAFGGQAYADRGALSGQVSYAGALGSQGYSHPGRLGACTLPVQGGYAAQGATSAGSVGGLGAQHFQLPMQRQQHVPLPGGLTVSGGLQAPKGLPMPTPFTIPALGSGQLPALDARLRDGAAGEMHPPALLELQPRHPLPAPLEPERRYEELQAELARKEGCVQELERFALAMQQALEAERERAKKAAHEAEPEVPMADLRKTREGVAVAASGCTALGAEVAKAADIAARLNTWFAQNAAHMRTQESRESPSAYLEAVTKALKLRVEGLLEGWFRMQTVLSAGAESPRLAEGATLAEPASAGAAAGTALPPEHLVAMEDFPPPLACAMATSGGVPLTPTRVGSGSAPVGPTGSLLSPRASAATPPRSSESSSPAQAELCKQRTESFNEEPEERGLYPAFQSFHISKAQ